MVKEKTKRSRLKDWGIVLLALVDDVAVLVLVMVVLWLFGVRLTVPVLVILAVILGALAFIVHKAVIPSLYARNTAGAEAMIGLECDVTQSLNPAGTVRVCGEYWKARSVDGKIAAGRQVEVVAIRGLVLEVKRKDKCPR